jgi:drug/metabolite transporter (DMT)-like permease
MNFEEKTPPAPPLLVIFIGILAVSTASIFIRFAQAEASSLSIAAYRLVIASLVLAPIALLRYRRELAELTRGKWGIGILSGLFLAVHFTSWISSLEYTSVASSVVLVTTTPIWVALFSPFTIRESITRRILIGMGMALLGTVIIGLGDLCTFSPTINCPPLSSFVQGRAIFGDLLALIGAWSAAGYMLAGRTLREELSSIPYVFIVYGSAALILIIMVAALNIPLAGFSPPIYLWLVLIGLVPQLIGHSAFNWALGYLPASLVSVSLLGEPIGTTILAVIILREVPKPLNGFGAILILMGILIASQEPKHNGGNAHAG